MAESTKKSSEGEPTIVRLSDLNGPTFIICKVGWCGYCVKLTHSIKNDAAVQSAIDKLGIKIIDHETQVDEEDKKLMQKLNIQGFPHVAYFDDAVMITKPLFNPNLFWKAVYIANGMKSKQDFIQSIAPVNSMNNDQKDLDQHVSYRLHSALLPSLQYIFWIAILKILGVQLDPAFDKAYAYLRKYYDSNIKHFKMIIHKDLLNIFEQMLKHVEKKDLKKNPVLRYYLITLAMQAIPQMQNSPLLKQDEQSKLMPIGKQLSEMIQKTDPSLLLKESNEAFSGFKSSSPAKQTAKSAPLVYGPMPNVVQQQQQQPAPRRDDEEMVGGGSRFVRVQLSAEELSWLKF